MNKFVAFLCVFLIFSLQGKAQVSSFRTYSVNEGVAQSQVYSIIQDQQGALWMATRGGGISIFDGKEFKTINEKDGLINNFVYKLIQGKDQRIWIGTNNGVSVYDGDKFKSFQLPKTQGNLAVFDLCFLNENEIWLGTNQGIFAVRNDKLVDLNSACSFEPNNVNAICQDAKGAIWIGTGNGIHKIVRSGSKFKRTFMGDRFKNMKNAITSFRFDRKGNLYFGTYGDGLYCYNYQQVYRIDLNKELYKTSVFDIYFDKEGTCWIATLDKGILSYQPASKKFTSFNQNQGLSNNHVRAIVQDNTNNMWFGTSGGGVCQFNGSAFSHYNTESGLGGNFVYSIFRDSKARLWLGTGQNGVSVMQNDSFEQFNATNGFESIKVKAIVENQRGILFFGTEGKGIYKFENESFTLVPGSEKAYVRQLDLHPDGNVWAATSGMGLLKIDANSNRVTEQFNYANARLLQSRLTCLFIDKFGRIWYGAESYGLGIIDPKTRKTWRFTTKNGLSSNAIRSITADNKGTVWVGTAGDGVIALNEVAEPKILKTIKLNDGLFSANVYLLVCDKNKLIVGTESGIDVITMNESLEIKKIKHYGKSDGFIGVETCQNSVFKDGSGKIWFGTINGMTSYHADRVNENKIPPIISISDVLLFYESVSKTSYAHFLKPWGEINTINLPHNQNHLSFLFNGINHRNPDGVEFSWKMKGMEDAWSPWSKEQRIVYSNLNSGNYTFLLRARNEDGAITATPISIAIEIATPFWKRIWFIVLVFALILFSLYKAYKWQTNRIKLKAKQEQNQLEMAKNLLELEQKALRLQMNPHFIFNALNSIQGLIGTPNETEARYYLAKFSRLMRQILDNSRKSTITLEDETASLENYLLIEQFCAGNTFDYEISSNLVTEPNYIEMPPMIIQPFVENAIKHGFKFHDKGKRGHLSIRFTETENKILCEIEDNGIGRQKAKELNEKSMDHFHQSTGLNVTQERLDLFSEDRSDASIKITDKQNESGESSGTLVQITIPFI